MAKKKPAKSDRQAKIDAIRSQQKGAERRRGLMIVGVCVVVAVLIIGAAAYQPIKDWYDQREFADLDLAAIGAPASVCQEVETKTASGNQDHVEPGTDIPYEEAPPAFGTHYNVVRRRSSGSSTPPATAPTSASWCTTSSTATRSSGTTRRSPTTRRRWTSCGACPRSSPTTTTSATSSRPSRGPSEDGDAFPDGQHIAFTHWSVGGDGDPSGEQSGVWQYCSEPSGEALEQFMKDYPYTDSPEPDAI